MRNRLILVAVVLVLGSLGCAFGTTIGTGTSTSGSPIATLAPTTAPTATQVPAALITKCFGSSASRMGAVIAAGDMLYSQPLMSGLAYPSVKLPDGTSLTQPYKLNSTFPSTDFPNSPATNPAITYEAGGFTFGVCNASATKTHTLQALTVKITTFNGYSAQLNQWNGCDGTTDSHHQQTASGCGGAIAGCMCFHAPFAASATAGTEVTTSQADDSLNNPGDNAGKLPFAMGPGQEFLAYISMEKPAAAGQYTFIMGMQVDGQTSYTLGSPNVLLAPIAHKWTGLACQNNSAMLAQITPTNPETYYICPA